MTSARADAPGAPRLGPRRFGAARILLGNAIGRGAAALGGRRLYRRRHLARGRFRVRTERVRVPGLPAGLRGFRIAHLSDLHAGPFLGAGDLADVVDAVNGLGADLGALTGDLITGAWEEALAPLEDLARLRARHGWLGVFGNHDYHGRREGEIAAAYAEIGVRFLRNECARIEVEGGALAVIGLEDLEESLAVDLAGPRAAVREGDVEVVLCHNPAGAPLVARPGCAAVLSGHTHGGQLALPLLRRLGPPHPGDRQDLGGTAVITNLGLGCLVLPLRIGAPAEVVCVVLEAA